MFNENELEEEEELDIKKNRQYYVALIAGFGVGFATGTALGWTNPVYTFIIKSDDKQLGDFKREWVFSKREFHVTFFEYALIISSLSIGAVVASIPCGFLVDSIGRKSMMLLLFGPFLLGWLIIVAAPNIWWLCIGQSVLGMACAASAVVGPMYMSEISTKEARGIVGSFFKLLMTVGMLFSFVVGAFIKPISLTIVCTLMLFVTFAPMMWLPESPTYLVWCGNSELAIRALACVHGVDFDLGREYLAIESAIYTSRPSAITRRSFQQKACVKALYISLGLVSCLQLSGVNLIVLFSTAIFHYSGGFRKPHISTIIIGVVYVISTLISILVVDKLGRRLLLLISTSVMTVFVLILGFYYCFQQQIDIKELEYWLPLVCLSIALVMFSLGIGTVPWLMIGELFPPDLKGPATSVATTFYWLIGTLRNILAACSLQMLGPTVTLFIFGIIQISSLFFIFFYVPETKGKSLMEIQQMLSKHENF